MRVVLIQSLQRLQVLIKLITSVQKAYQLKKQQISKTENVINCEKQKSNKLRESEKGALYNNREG